MAPPASTMPRAGVHDQAAARAIGGAVQHVGDRGARLAAIGLDQLHAAVGVHVGARGDRVRQVRRPRRTLGVDRAAHAAVAEARAAFDAAADELRVPAQLAPAVEQRAVVGVDVVGVAVRHVQPRLGGGEVRRQHGRVQIAHAVAVGPQAQRRLRRAERRCPVDGGAAADVAPLQDHDRQIVGGAVAVLLVQRGVDPGFLHVEVGARVVAAFFQHGDARAGLGQHRRRDAAARAAADDDVVDLERRRRAAARRP